MSAGTTITVTKVQVNKSASDGGESKTWRCYKHSKYPSAPFKFLKITHSDQTMEGGGLNNDMSTTFPNVTAVYVYYESLTQIHQPRVICIDKGSSNRNWYIAGQNADNWAKDDTNFTSSDPDSVKESELQTAAGASRLTVTGSDYVIKLDKRPKEATPAKAIKYVTGNDPTPSKRVVTVEKTVGSSQAGSKVPEGYVRYKHSPPAGSPINGTIIYKHNGFPLKLEPAPPTAGVTAVYVYYKSGTDDQHQFPLIVCVKTNSGRKYYKRGNEWKDISSTITYGPDNSQVKSQLQSQFNPLISQYEVKLEKTVQPSEYKARPQSPQENITVEAIGPGTTSYKGYRHYINSLSPTDRANRITIHGNVTNGISNDVLDTFQFSTGGGVYVYYAKTGDDELQRPYLICLSKDGRASSTPGENIWYKRTNNPQPNTWTLENDPSYNQIDPGQISQLENKLRPIKDALDRNGDTGYTKPVSVEIFIHFNTWKLYTRT